MISLHDEIMTNWQAIVIPVLICHILYTNYDVMVGRVILALILRMGNSSEPEK